MSGVKLTDIVEKMNLKNLTPEVDITEREVLVPDVNRPALQLAGFFDHFDLNRVQIIGNVECAYLETLTEERRLEIYQKLLEHKVPCIIFSNELQPDESFLELAEKNDIPVFGTCKKTSSFMGELIRWLNVKLAPCISIHGVLVDVYGVGVLIMGESGIGKSEAALELIKRGHRLVTDDVVEIRKVSDETLVGSAPDITRHFIELPPDSWMIFLTVPVPDNLCLTHRASQCHASCTNLHRKKYLYTIHIKMQYLTFHSPLHHILLLSKVPRQL